MRHAAFFGASWVIISQKDASDYELRVSLWLSPFTTNKHGLTTYGCEASGDLLPLSLKILQVRHGTSYQQPAATDRPVSSGWHCALHGRASYVSALHSSWTPQARSSLGVELR
jgi:hypothetical protein